MKIFLALVTALILNQNVFATGAYGEDPGAAMLDDKTKTEAGVEKPGYSGYAQQKASCPNCQLKEEPTLYNNVGVINSSNISDVNKSSSPRPDETRQ